MGQLQRGHGAIARAIFRGAVPGAREMLLGCLTEDPRWDRQLDDRADYLAVLAPAVFVSAAEIAAVVEAGESAPLDVDPGASLALDVLLRSAARDQPGALDQVRTYVVQGRYWAQALDAIVHDGSGEDVRADWRERMDGILTAVKVRWPTLSERAEAFGDSDVEPRRAPWPDWAAEDPEIAAALDAGRSRRQSRPAGEVRERLRDQPTEQLLSESGDPGRLRLVAAELTKRTGTTDVTAMLRVAGEPAAPMHAVAVFALAAQHHSEVLPAISALSQATWPGVAHGLLFRALGALPYEVSRPTVTRWLDDDDVSRRRAAAAAMGQHSVAADVTLARDALSRELDAGLHGEQYLVCSYADALARHPALGPFPELTRAYQEMPYSYGRRFAVDAIVATDPSFPEVCAVDCLWDAEPSIRARAAHAADLAAPGTTSRLSELTADRAQVPAVRAAARARLSR
jgi:hypothetical protein